MTDTAPDIVIHDATVLTVDDRNRLYENGTVVVADGERTAVRSTESGDAEAAAIPLPCSDSLPPLAVFQAVKRRGPSELPLPTRRLRRLLEAGASCFHDALCRHRMSVRRERSLHRR
jgi:hypothetical protein